MRYRSVVNGGWGVSSELIKYHGIISINFVLVIAYIILIIERNKIRLESISFLNHKKITNYLRIYEICECESTNL
jgi:hypothetical protein